MADIKAILSDKELLEIIAQELLDVISRSGEIETGGRHSTKYSFFLLFDINFESLETDEEGFDIRFKGYVSGIYEYEPRTYDYPGYEGTENLQVEIDHNSFELDVWNEAGEMMVPVQVNDADIDSFGEDIAYELEVLGF